MPKRIYVKPTDPDVIVREPDQGRRLSNDGAWVEKDYYWIRRIKDGSVVEAAPPAKTPAKASKSKAEAASDA